MAKNTAASFPTYDNVADENKFAVISSGVVALKRDPLAVEWANTTAWPTNPGAPGNVNNVAVANSLFFALGDAGNMAVSSNGTDWTPCVTNAAATVTMTAVAYGGGVYVAVGSAGTIISSTDGINWTLQVSNVGTAVIAGVTYGAGAFSAVTTTIASIGMGVGIRSTDGVTWTVVSIAFGSSRITELAYGAGVFVGVGVVGTVFYSTNGTTWTQVDGKFGINAVNGVQFLNSLFVAFGAAGTLSTSPDGITWTARDSQFGANAITGVAFGAGVWVVCGSGNAVSPSTISSSADGVTWTRRVSMTRTGLNRVRFLNSLFVAVGTFFLTSADGLTWTQQSNTLPKYSGNGFTDVAFGAGVYVAVSGVANGILLSSPDAVTWTARTSNFGNNIFRGVIFDSALTLFVAYGDNTISFVTSPDGTTWTTRAHNLALACNQIISTAGPLLVAVSSTSSAGKISTSTNGTAWTARTTNAINILMTVAFGGGMYVAAGGGGATSSGSDCVSSPDGTTWTSRQTEVNGASGSAQGIPAGVSYLNSLFVAHGTRGHIATSTDGLTWTQRSVNTTSTFTKSAFGAGVWFVCGTAGVGYSSPDGTTWTSRTTQFSANAITGIIFDNSLFVMWGVLGLISTSTDGLTWVARTSAMGTNAINAVVWGNSTFVAVGVPAALVQATAPNVATSTDGITWTAGTDQFLFSEQAQTIMGAAFTGGVFVGVGASTAGSGAIVSSNGVAWTNHALPIALGGLAAVAYNGIDTHVVVGTGGVLMSSTDGGETWVTRNGQCGYTAFSGVVFGAGVFVAYGQYGMLASSADGITWTARNPQFGTANINSAVFAAGVFVIVGNNGLVSSSTDGATWTARTSNAPSYASLTKVKFLNSLFLTLGSGGTLVTSTDGATWTARTLTWGDESSVDVAYGAGVFVVVGTGGRVSYSAAGATWTQAVSKTGVNILGVAFGNGVFAANTTAAGTNLPTSIWSADGITWIAVTNKVAATATDSPVVFNEGVFVVARVASGLMSIDGKTWVTRTTGQMTNNAGTQNLSVCGTELFQTGLTSILIGRMRPYSQYYV